MFARIVCFVLVAAIVACPMWCASSTCRADESCRIQQPSDQPCPGHRRAGCCGGESPDSEDQCPCRCPGESLCQGVCSGAVFEKAIPLNVGMDSSYLPLIADELPAGCQLAKCRKSDGSLLLECGGNQGRFLRTQHMSLLC